MILQSSLRPEGGIQGYLPTTLFHRWRIKRQLEQIEKIKKENLRNKQLQEARRKKEEYSKAQQAQQSQLADAYERARDQARNGYYKCL